MTRLLAGIYPAMLAIDERDGHYSYHTRGILRLPLAMHEHIDRDRFIVYQQKTGCIKNEGVPCGSTRPLDGCPHRRPALTSIPVFIHIGLKRLLCAELQNNTQYTVLLSRELRSLH